MSEITTKSEIETYLKDVYELYCLWKSLPAFLKYPPKDKSGFQPTSRMFAENLGIDYEMVLLLLDIKTQTEFAERYSVSKDTLSDWNKTFGVRQSLQDIKTWAKRLSKNVLMALYNTAIRKGQAMEVKLFFQLIEGWEEKQKMEHELKGVDVITIIKTYEPTTSKIGIDTETK